MLDYDDVDEAAVSVEEEKRREKLPEGESDDNCVELL